MYLKRGFITRVLKGLFSEYVLTLSKKEAIREMLLFYMAKDELNAIKRNKRIMFIEDINKSLFKNSEDVFFNMFRMENIEHFLIDEFQDTDKLQWKNIERLVENGLSKGGSLFVVGDRKQGIYEWRGGSPELFNTVKESFSHFNIREERLEYNYRSGKSIVSFINRVFDVEKNPFLKSYTILSHFKESVQKATKDFDGYVEVRFNKDDEELNLNLVKNVKELIERYNFSDIAILVRKNSHAKEISRLLMDENIPVVSQETFLLSSSHIIKGIISFLKFLSLPEDDIGFSALLLNDMFLKNARIDGLEIRRFIMNAEEGNPLYLIFKKKFKSLWDIYIEPIYSKVNVIPLYDLIRMILELFNIEKLFKGELPFVTAFLELVFGFENETQKSVDEFLNFFTSLTEEDSPALKFPEGVNAVRILTIHKAKGLQFPVIMFPLKNSQKKRELFAEGRDFFIINKSYAEKNKRLFGMERRKEEQDLKASVNLIYVAMTRAINELYIHSVNTGKESGIREIFNRLIEYRFGELQSFFSSGSKMITKKECKETEFPPISLSSLKTPSQWQKIIYKGIDIRTEEIQEGIDVHRMLEVFEDESFLKDSNVKQGLEQKAFRFVYKFFKDRNLLDAVHIVEKDFVDSKGEIIRPDRIVIKDDVVYIIDFKTGRQRNKDVVQLRHYMQTMKNIFLKDIKGYILYMREEIVKEVGFEG